MSYIRGMVFPALLLVIAALPLRAQVPVLQSYVTDLAGVLSAEDKNRLEIYLQDYDQNSGNQFVVLVISSLEDESIEEYAFHVAEKNKIGRKGKDNGLLFLVSVNDRKMRFEVGYGLEAVLTDAYTSLIISDIVATEFRKGDYSTGIFAGMKAAVQAASGELSLSEHSSRRKSDDDGDNVLGVIILLVILFFVFRKNRRRGGGGSIFIGSAGSSRRYSSGGYRSSGGSRGFSGGGSRGFSGGGGSFGGGGASGGW